MSSPLGQKIYQHHVLISKKKIDRRFAKKALRRNLPGKKSRASLDEAAGNFMLLKINFDFRSHEKNGKKKD